MPQLPEIAQRSAAWHAARRGRITASLAAAVLGLDPHRGPLSAWNEITGRKNQAVSGDMAYGNAFEAEARADYETQTGELVTDAGFWVHDAMPWLGASPDGLVGRDGLCEIKCPQALPAALPRHHEIQIRVQLAVTGRQWCHYFAWVRPEHVLFTVFRNKAQEQNLLERLLAFHVAFVLTDTPPPRRRPKETT